MLTSLELNRLLKIFGTTHIFQQNPDPLTEKNKYLEPEYPRKIYILNQEKGK